MMTAHFLKFGAALMLAAPLIGGQAYAAGGGGSDTPPTQTQTSKDCKKGQVWNSQTKKCVKAQSGMMDDDTLFEAARELAYFDRHEEAIDLLKMAANQNAPRILNYLGFSNRKAGRMDVAMGYYRQALAIDPEYTLARSYYGQALIDTGDIKGAQAELAAIRRIAGPANYPYFALAQSLRSGKTY